VLKRSPTTRFEAKDEKATKRPLAEIAGNELSEFPCVPSELTLRSVVLPRFRSCRKTSTWPFRSPLTRSDLLGAIQTNSLRNRPQKMPISRGFTTGREEPGSAADGRGYSGIRTRFRHSWRLVPISAARYSCRPEDRAMPFERAANARGPVALAATWRDRREPTAVVPARISNPSNTWCLLTCSVLA
jgi:hypothetical protein